MTPTAGLRAGAWSGVGSGLGASLGGALLGLVASMATAAIVRFRNLVRQPAVTSDAG